MTDFATARRHMVDGQVRPSDVTDLRIITAFGETPREKFVPAASQGLAYLDLDLPLGGTGRCLMKPMVLSKLIQALALEATDKVLVVGAATGYSAAIIATMAGDVTALEQDASLAGAAKETLGATGNVTVVTGGLTQGHAAGAPYDAILVEGTVEELPDSFRDQLRDGGRLVCVMGSAPSGRAMAFRRSGNELGGRPIFDASAAALPGFAKAPAFAL